MFFGRFSSQTRIPRTSHHEADHGARASYSFKSMVVGQETTSKADVSADSNRRPTREASKKRRALLESMRQGGGRDAARSQSSLSNFDNLPDDIGALVTRRALGSNMSVEGRS